MKGRGGTGGQDSLGPDDPALNLAALGPVHRPPAGTVVSHTPKGGIWAQGQPAELPEEEEP